MQRDVEPVKESEMEASNIVEMHALGLCRKPMKWSPAQTYRNGLEAYRLRRLSLNITGLNSTQRTRYYSLCSLITRDPRYSISWSGELNSEGGVTREGTPRSITPAIPLLMSVNAHSALMS